MGRGKEDEKEKEEQDGIGQDKIEQRTSLGKKRTGAGQNTTKQRKGEKEGEKDGKKRSRVEQNIGWMGLDTNERKR